MKRTFRILGATVAIFFTVVFATSTFLFIKRVWFGLDGNRVGAGHVEVLNVDGVIFSSSHFSRKVKDLLKDSSVKALVVRVNSPGGLVAPSQEMYHALRKADEKVPVVISMGSVAASGGYYLALGGRKIFANPGTLTASIGVIMEFVNTRELYRWAKIERQTITGGELKDAGTPLRPMTPKERKLFQDMVDDIHTQFRAAVSERRKLEGDALAHVTDGRVMTGMQAHAAKLVDELGGLEVAIQEAKQLGGLKDDAPVVYPDKDPGLFRRLVFGDDPEGRPHSLISFFSALLPDASIIPPDTGFGSGWRVAWIAPIR